MKQVAIIVSSRLQAHLLRSVRLLICLACLSLAQPFAAMAQTNEPAPLSPAAQEAVNKGIIAAKMPDYLLAIRYFEEARKLAPETPVIYLNLGLAESKIPGRELRAMAWFGAYLAAYPGAPNVAAVKEQIAVLEVKNQSNVSRLIQTLQDSSAKDYNRIVDVAKLWADSGDIATAIKTALLAGEIYGGSAQGYIAAVQAKAGDIAGALNTAGAVERPDYRIDAFLGIAAIQLERGDLNGAETAIALAQRAADQISDGDSKWGALKKIALLQIKAGKKDGAQATLRAALMALDLIEIPSVPELKDSYFSGSAQKLVYTAKYQLEAGDVAGAKLSLALAFKNSELIGDPYWRAVYQGNILENSAKAGDVSNAIKTFKSLQKSINLVTDANSKRLLRPAGHDQLHQALLSEAYLNAGDIDGALKTAGEIPNVDDKTNADYKTTTLINIIDVQVKAGNFDGALKTAKEIINVDRKMSELGDIIKAQVKAGDYRGAVKTNSEIADADKRAFSLYNIVKSQAEAKDFAGGAKNAELIQVIQYKEWAVNAIAVESAKANKPLVSAPVKTPQPTAAKPSPPARTAADWAKMLDNNSQYGVALNTEPFLNLAGYLKSLPPSDNPEKVFESLHETAQKIVKAQNVITGMLKQEARK